MSHGLADEPVEKRDVEIEGRDVEAEKRDLAGFNAALAALAFATGALKTGPEVQLGTGDGGSGVGIIVKAGAEMVLLLQLRRWASGKLHKVCLLSR